MESHPEMMEAMMGDVNDSCQFLQSLAKKVEQEEGRGELKVSFIFVCKLASFGFARYEVTLVSRRRLILFVCVYRTLFPHFQVINAPESTCILLTSKSYNWCKYRCMFFFSFGHKTFTSFAQALGS